MAQWFGVLWGKSTVLYHWYAGVAERGWDVCRLKQPKQHAEVDVGPPGAAAGLEGIVCG